MIIRERKNQLRIESQLSTTQEKIGAAKRRSELLESKNMKLEQDVEELSTMYAQEIVSNQQPIASGSGVPNPHLTMAITSTTRLVSASMPGCPQVIPTIVGSPEAGPTPFSAPQGDRCVSFGSVFDVSSGQGGNN